MILTKADILNGKNNIQEIEFPKLKGSLKLRPLSDGEYQKINNLMKNGGIGTVKTQINPKEHNKTEKSLQNLLDIEISPQAADKARYDADVKAIYYSLQHDEATEKWTEKDVKTLPAGSVDMIAMKVYEISGITDPNSTRQEVETFRTRK